jgi:hypothetical protein
LDYADIEFGSQKPSIEDYFCPTPHIIAI